MSKKVEPPAQPVQIPGYGQQVFIPVPAQSHLNGRDGAQYVRQQKGHSWILHWLVLGMFNMWIVPIYYSVSKNHYWHL